MSALDELERLERDFASHLQRREAGELRTSWDQGSLIRVYVTDLPEALCRTLAAAIDDVLPELLRKAYAYELGLRRREARAEAERTLDRVSAELAKENEGG